MDFDDTELASNSSSNIRSEFYCLEMLDLAYDLTDTTFAWSLLVIRCITCPCIILANIVVIVTMKKKKVLQKQSTILLSSLAVTDLLVGAVCIPLSVAVDILMLRQISFAHICTLDWLYIYFADFLSICSLYHLTVIAWERYVAIRKWMEYKVIVTASRVKKLAIAGWLATIFITVPVIVMEQTDVDYDVVDGWLAFEGVFVGVFLILLVYFYVMVYLEVRKRKINQIRQVTALVKAKMESKVAKTCGLLSAVAIFSHVPMAVLFLVGDYLPEVFQTMSGERSVETIVHFNSLMNSLLYSFRDRRFRNAVLELVGMRKPKAIKRAVPAMRSVKRKVPRGSVEDELEIKMAEKRTRLLRSESYDPVTVLDFAHRNNELMLNRSMSAPMLFNSCYDDQLLQEQTSSILTTTAIIHVQSGARDKGKKSNRDLPKHDVKTKLQGTAHLFRKLSRSKSWDASAIGVEFADRCCPNMQDRTAVRRSQSAPWLSTNVIVPNETLTTSSGFTTRF